ncbi:MAG: sodium:solute symporter family protein, partial [Candidatus Marinimicrobia bacterium]|nr:sodium:solute symporter family protein [Candidatus Neomarinimicrobiota bacterium]
MWVFVLAATATSFSGWTFMGHPGLIYRDGFQYAYASFYVITIPFTGVMFLKRQWILGKRFGYVTPGEMLADYFKGDMVRILTVVVALCFSVPYLGLQLAASGKLFNVLSDGLWGVTTGTWVLAGIVALYVGLGGLRSVAYVDTLQCVLLWFGIVAIGFVTYDLVGGWDALNVGLAKVALVEGTKWGVTPGDGYSAYFAIPGVIQFTAGLGKETPVGGLWTGVMVLTYMFALMGIHSSPAFSMWAFSNKDPEPFVPQQVWVSSFGMGIALFIFTVFQGMGAHILGADPVANAAGINISNMLPESIGKADQGNLIYLITIGDPESIGKGSQGNLVPYLINTIADIAPWLVGLLAVCALAAMQSTGAAYMSTCASMLTRDIYKKFFSPKMNHTEQILVGRICVIVVIGVALMIATFSMDALVLLGGLALAFSFQMWVPLASVCYFPWLTREGVSWGLLGGMVGVIMTESIGQSLFGDSISWGRWPWTMHSAFWGMLVNLAIAIPVSFMTQNSRDRAYRQKYHDFLADHVALPANKQSLKPAAWIITVAWLFFGIGPGAVIGNDIFGAPNDISTWTFGIPSIWAWQILFWLLGVGMMWFLAYKMEMSTLPRKSVSALVEDIGDAKA